MKIKDINGDKKVKRDESKGKTKIKNRIKLSIVSASTHKSAVLLSNARRKIADINCFIENIIIGLSEHIIL